MKLFRIIGVAACVLAAITLASGCASDPNKHTSRVVGGAGKGYKIGIGENAVSQLYELGLQDVDMAAMVVPITEIISSNGVATVVTPDAILSAEYGGKATFFGSGSSTYTIAVGVNACNTLLGGMHMPINSPYWTNSAVGLSQTLPAASPTTTSITNSNGTATTSSPVPTSPASLLKP